MAENMKKMMARNGLVKQKKTDREPWMRFKKKNTIM